MEIERILQARANRKSRIGRPFEVFQATFDQCVDAARSVIAEPASKHADLLERAVIITMVSGIEVYYKDVLDGIFRLCSPSFFEPHLKRIHSAKYDIAALLQFHRNGVHPLELIAANQSFQSAETIDAVFSQFLGKSLWTAVMERQYRFKDTPENEFTFEPSLPKHLKRLFSLRHELVHDKSQQRIFSLASLDTIVLPAYLLFGTDIVLMGMISRNLDPELHTAGDELINQSALPVPSQDGSIGVDDGAVGGVGD